MSDTVNVAAGETLAVASGQTVESSEVVNAGTVSNAGTVQADLVQALAAIATDADTATATLQTERDIVAVASDADTATATLQADRDIVAVASDTDTATAGLAIEQALTAVATDTDSATAVVRDGIALVASASDIDSAAAPLSPESELSAVASDIDDATATVKIPKPLDAVASDTDAATAPIAVVDAGNDPVQVVVDLLSAEGSGAFAIDGEPVVKRYFDDAASERGPGAGQQPVIYVWSPTSATLDRHSMDDRQFYRENTLQVLIMSLREDEAIDLVGSVVNVLSQFLQDNRSITPFNDLAPVQSSDFRRQTSARKTDHFVTRVTVETKNLPTTGLAKR